MHIWRCLNEPRKTENLTTTLLEGPTSPEKWAVETNRRFDMPGGFESEEEGSAYDWGSSEELEPDKHFVVRHNEPAREPGHKAPANPQSEVESLGKGRSSVSESAATSSPSRFQRANHAAVRSTENPRITDV